VGSVGFQEILVIALIALLVFGPERLPEMAREAGKWIARFRAETSKSLDELKRAAEVEDLERELRAMKQELRSLGREFTGLDGAGGPPNGPASSGPASSANDPASGNGAGQAEQMVTSGAPMPRQDPPPFDPDAT
jgi:sec-independent protein translocase protein TatB